MNILKDADLAPFHLKPGDTISVDWNGETMLAEPIKNHTLVNRCIIFEVQDQFGFKTGIGAILGERE